MIPSLKRIFIFIVMLVAFFNCSEEKITISNSAPRKIQFSLYTDKDLSNDNGAITFTLTIQKSNKVLWDSVLAPIKIKEIPSAANKIVIEKLVPNNDSSQLKVGFLYSIEGVGNSWYFDVSSAGEHFKVVDFNFQ